MYIRTCSCATTVFLYFVLIYVTECSEDQRRLYEDLLNNYNKLVRPIRNSSHAVNIQFKLKLVQILDVHEKNQVVTLNGWLIHEWYDYKLTWSKNDYGGIEVMHIPAELIWLPDIILYNNADGSPEVTTLTKVLVRYNGTVTWTPPVIYNSMCQIDIEWFPMDQQFCALKFGSWTYYGSEVSMQHLQGDESIEQIEEGESKAWTVERGIDLSQYQESVEWDLMSGRGIRHERRYPCCSYPFVDITYHINIRRKTLFYTINLITPCVGITFLTSLVFYLPSESNNKITLSVSVLISLTVFFLLLIEIIPPTSLVVPMIAKYLIFTMILVSLSVCVTVIILNIHYRSGSMYPMPGWVRKFFISFMPRLLRISRLSAKRHALGEEAAERVRTFQRVMSAKSEGQKAQGYVFQPSKCSKIAFRTTQQNLAATKLISNLEEAKRKAFRNVCYIAEEIKLREYDDNLKDDWKFVAMIVDRIFLIVFTTAIMFGTGYIILSAPTLWDNRIPITEIIRREMDAKKKST